MVDRVALITALILDRAMCVPCITTRAGTDTEETVAIIQLIGGSLTVHHGVGRCMACRREDGLVVFADQPAI